MFAITKIHITEARYSVDGKRHQRTLYYGGMVEHKGVGVFEHWGKKAEAKLFASKSEAQSYARMKGGKVREVSR